MSYYALNGCTNAPVLVLQRGNTMNEELPLQPLTLVSDELTPAQKVRLQLLANTHMGQQVMTEFLLNQTPATHESLANLEKLAQWVLTTKTQTNQ